MKKFYVFILAVLFLASVPASAQQVKDKDEAVRDIMQLARDHITELKDSTGKNIPAETAEEKKTPIIPFEDGKRTVGVGSITGMAEWCGLDWKKNYTSYMQYERAKQKWSDKQLAYISAIHGISQQIVIDGLKKGNQPCSADRKDKITKFMSLQKL